MTRKLLHEDEDIIKMLKDKGQMFTPSLQLHQQLRRYQESTGRYNQPQTQGKGEGSSKPLAIVNNHNNDSRNRADEGHDEFDEHPSYFSDMRSNEDADNEYESEGLDERHEEYVTDKGNQQQRSAPNNTTGPSSSTSSSLSSSSSSSSSSPAALVFDATRTRRRWYFVLVWS